MKYKVLLIDDEPIIRKGLKNIIHWEQYQCEVCAEASNGVEGLMRIQQYQPDIVFTDIRMPEMTGLEMIEELGQQYPSMKVIILTGFRDFEYVKEALILGAFDFLLKPTKLADIKQVVKRAVDQLDMQHHRLERFDALARKFDESLPKLREKFFYDLMMGIITDEDQIHVDGDALDAQMENYIMALARISPVNPDQSRGMQYGALQTFQEMLCDQYCIHAVSINSRESIFIVKIDELKMIDLLYNRCIKLQDMMKESLGMSLEIAISDLGDNLLDLARCRQQCMEAIQYAGLPEYGDFILYRDVGRESHDDLDVRIQGLSKLLLDAAPRGDESYINALESEVRRRGQLSPRAQKHLLDTAASLQALADQSQEVIENTSPANILRTIRRLFRQVSKQEMHATKQQYRLILQKAIDYLNAHYTEPITLQQVADAVYVSPYYISRLFSREIHQTLTEYLNDIRIRKACELLKDVEYKIYQIGEMVGIPDAHYFSRIFKRAKGMTPSEYRNTAN